MKKLGYFFFMVWITINLVGCTGGSYAITFGGISSTEHQLNGEYDSFSGYYFKNVQLRDGESLSLSFSGVTEKGKVMAKVIDSNGKTVKTLNIGDKVMINHPGNYKLQVEGNKHKGKFTLAWDIE